MTNEVTSRDSLIHALEKYTVEQQEEELTRKYFLRLLTTDPSCAHRETLPAHLTASAWVLNATYDSCLLIFHKKLGMWIQPGGHADGDFNLVEVAKREVREETGLSVHSLSAESIFDLDIHDIPGGVNTPPHQHFDVRYLFRAEQGAQLVHNEEVHAARWVTFGEVEQYTTEYSILRMRDRGEAVLSLLREGKNIGGDRNRSILS